MNDLPYLHGETLTKIPPLGSYLPQVQKGVVTSWLSGNLSPPDWVLCPFGSSPLPALEMARAGFRVLIPVHNPILRFLIKKQAAPPSREALNSALVTLASSYKGTDRLKPHLLSLYETDCPQCGRKTSGASFIWNRSSQELVSKICRCGHCGEKTAGEAAPADKEKAREFSSRSPTYARALTRVTSPSDPIRVQVEKALASYPPRSVYALFTALNKVAGFNLPDEELSNLEVLLLHAFSRCSQPLVSTLQDEDADSLEEDTYREENVWFAMEDALENWPDGAQSIQVTSWPESPPEGGGIAIYPGRVKDLIPQLIGFPIRAVVMVYPRPAPDFWSLSALWTGWLWGQEAAAPLRGILTSRDMDWPWMTQAALVTLRELSDALPDQTPALGLMPGIETSSLLSWTSGSLSAGLTLENLAVDPDHHQGQSRWTINPLSKPVSSQEIDHRAVIRGAGMTALQSAGEPAHTLSLYSAGMAGLAGAGYPPADSRMAEAGDYFPRLVIDFEENIAYRQGFLHYSNIESWWHQEMALDPTPRSDQVEMKLVQSLVEGGGAVEEKQLYQMIYDAFPGLETPRAGLIEACLVSYGKRETAQLTAWSLKPNDQPASRIQDLQEMEGIISAIGTDLGYQTATRNMGGNLTLVTWDENGKVAERFFISASGLLSKVINNSGKDNGNGWIILPGSRAELIHYKMRYNPILGDIIQKKWKLIKYRLLRRLREEGGITKENYQERLCLDPFTSDSPQLPLI